MLPPLRRLIWLLLLASVLHADESPRERLSFNRDWRFTRGDHPGTGEALRYERVKDWVLPTSDDLLKFQPTPRPRPPRAPGGYLTGGAERLAYVQPDFDDSAWRRLDLPHDWGIEGPFQADLPGETGKLPWFGVGWYRKKFALPASDAGRLIHLELDGAMSYALVWCNGEFVGGWPYGYASWRVDLTPFLRPGAENVVAIRLDNPRDSSRWYPGGGLYRNVWLTKTAPLCVGQWGVHVTTPSVTREAALVDVGLTLENRTSTAAEVEVAVSLYSADPLGQPVGEPVAVSPARIERLAPGRLSQLSHTLRVMAPRLWSLRTPHRYVAQTTLSQAGRVLDVVRAPFGIRTVAHTADDGFRLNGERLPLRGVCLHHDLGALGAAFNFRALERQLRILQSMGCNAIRTSHNPPAPELLELCDRLGLLVIVEAFDCWWIGKKRDDYSRLFVDWHEKDLRAMVRRDRNHPSVIAWSIGNEIREQHEPDAWKLAQHLASLVRDEDRTRAVVAGFSTAASGYNGFQNAVDVVGFNYKPDDYAKLRAVHPHLAQMGAETSSCVSSRGEYFFPVSDDPAAGRADFQISSYDLYAPRWGFPPDREWRALDENPFTLGEFVWTGFDYLGEPTPYSTDTTNLLNFSDPAEQARAAAELRELGRIRVPSRSSYFGLVDLAGFPKDRFFLYQARWRPDLPMAHLVPHWNWSASANGAGREGQITPVHVYTSGDEAELFLNGRSLGRKQRGPFDYRLRWDDVVYEPGELKVVAYREGRPWAEAARRTTGPAAQLLLSTDRPVLDAGGIADDPARNDDLAFVTVAVADRDGQLVPRAKPRIRFSVTGPGEIVATDNGDPTSFESFQSPERHAFNGLALAIIRPRRGQSGPITLRAEADGLTPATITLHSR